MYFVYTAIIIIQYIAFKTKILCYIFFTLQIVMVIIRTHYSSQNHYTIQGNYSEMQLMKLLVSVIV